MIRKMLLSLGILISALTLHGPAKAQTVPGVPIPTGCVNSVPNNHYWPYQNIYNCGATSTNEANARAGLVNLGGFAGKWYGKTGYIIFLYPTQAAYTAQSASFGANYLAPTSAKFSLTKFDANNNPLYSVIFEQNGDSDVNPLFEYSAAREAAKGLDYAIGFVANGGVFVQPNISFSSNAAFTNYANQLNNATNGDWATFGTQQQCYIAGTGYGVFSKEKDSTGAYICNGTNTANNPPTPDGQGTALNTPYLGLSNKEILQKAWPDDFKDNTAAPLYQPTFAAILAYNAIGPSNNVPTFFNGATSSLFKCTSFLGRFVANNGSLPTTASSGVPSGCPTLATAPGTASNPITQCKTIFNGNAGFPVQGYLFDCTTAQSLGAGLNSSLGRLGGTSVTAPIKQLLLNGGTYIYVWDTAQMYVNTFTGRGVYVDNSVITTGHASAVTHPSGSVEYVSVFITPFGLTTANTPTQMTEITDHELGHAVDEILTYQSGSATFSDATENDLQNLDFDIVGVNQAASHQRNACSITGYVGPLVGIVDPSPSANGGYFCSNGAYVRPTVYGTALIHLIMRAFNGGATTVFTTGPTPDGTKSYPGGWSENYAQSFKDRAYPDTGGSGAAPVRDGAVSNGYFPCTAGASGYLSQVYSGQTTINTSTLPAGCSHSTVQPWFDTLIKMP